MRSRTLSDDLQRQRDFVTSRAPSYVPVLTALLRAPELETRLDSVWAGRRFDAWYERPLMLLGALREEALLRGQDHPLHAQLVDGAVWRVDQDRLADALQEGRRVWQLLATRFLQTNASTRAVVWLWTASRIMSQAPGSRVRLVDIGASAGLNLLADRLPMAWTDGRGPPLALTPLPEIVGRTGFDLNPLDLSDDDDVRWLQALVWPNQRRRLRRLEEGLRAFAGLRGTAGAVQVTRASAEDVPAQLPLGGADRVIAYQTILRDYLSPVERDRYLAGMDAWLRRSAPGRALWVQLEQEPGEGPPALFSVHGWDGQRRVDIHVARCEPHPEVVAVGPGAAERLDALLAVS